MDSPAEVVPETAVLIKSQSTQPQLKRDKPSKRSHTETKASSAADPLLTSESMKPNPKKDKSSKRIKAEHNTTKTSDTIESEVPREAESKPKRDKSSKKRKATGVTESSCVGTHLEPSAQDIGSEADAAVLNRASEPASKKRKLSVDEIEVDITAPEPPSKKALRSLKKGKPLPPSKSGAPTPEPQTKKPDQEKRSEYGVWIGNLAWTTSKDDLRQFLVDFSDITPEMITRVHMPGPDDKKPVNKVVERKVGKQQHNTGFAYVDFSAIKGVEWAIELSEQLLSGRRLLIKDSKSYEGRPAKTKEETRIEGKPPNRKVFIGNLSYDITDEILTEHFKKCGPIQSVKVAAFQDSGKCKGYGWIFFEDIESAQHAVRGFVKIEEEVSDEEDSESDVLSDKEISKLKNTRTRKWWLNKIQGRPLKVEFAEDAQVRYKKRYGKEGTKRPGDGPVAAYGSGEEVKENQLPAKVAPRHAPVRYDLPHGGPQLTGGIVEATGKKIKF